MPADSEEKTGNEEEELHIIMILSQTRTGYVGVHAHAPRPTGCPDEHHSSIKAFPYLMIQW